MTPYPPPYTAGPSSFCLCIHTNSYPYMFDPFRLAHFFQVFRRNNTHLTTNPGTSPFYPIILYDSQIFFFFAEKLLKQSFALHQLPITLNWKKMAKRKRHIHWFQLIWLKRFSIFYSLIKILDHHYSCSKELNIIGFPIWQVPGAEVLKDTRWNFLSSSCNLSLVGNFFFLWIKILKIYLNLP